MIFPLPLKTMATIPDLARDKYQAREYRRKASKIIERDKGFLRQQIAEFDRKIADIQRERSKFVSKLNSLG